MNKQERELLPERIWVTPSGYWRVPRHGIRIGKDEREFVRTDKAVEAVRAIKMTIPPTAEHDGHFKTPLQVRDEAVALIESFGKVD